MFGDNTLSPYSVPGLPPGAPAGPSTTVTSSDTVVNGIVTKGLTDYVAIEVLNTASTALASFRVQMQLTRNGAWYDYILSNAWGTVDRVMVRQSGLPTVAGNAAGWAVIRVNGLYAVQFVATTGSGTTTVVCNWNRAPMARSF